MNGFSLLIFGIFGVIMVCCVNSETNDIELNTLNLFGKTVVINAKQLILIFIGYTIVISLITCIFCQMFHTCCGKTKKRKLYNSIPASSSDVSESESAF
mmetsp:Transcript_27023/g.32912  ORF Transcript_27023/g.32912 Transcript_27023/m.32912 type:complete len:99 (-) Transcript_27023:252-548(-)